MNKVLCFGELLLRMSPSLNGSSMNNSSMPFFIGGAELNVATALAKWNVPVKYFTALPDNYLSKKILEYLQQRNIDISSIPFSGKRIGIYYLPQGADLKNTGVIYDRDNSSFAELQPGIIDWKNVLQDVSWFHFSAINPALNENAQLVCKEALEAASKKNIIISVDLNYRSKLWQYGKQPVEIMPGLVQYCDIVMGNIWSAKNLLGIPLDEALVSDKTKENYLRQSESTAKEIKKKFPKVKTVANTFRFDESTGISYYATLFSGNQQFVSKEFHLNSVVDKVGSGDCFMAGLIYGLQQEFTSQHIIDFSAAAAVGKLLEKGDATNQTIEKINAFI